MGTLNDRTVTDGNQFVLATYYNLLLGTIIRKDFSNAVVMSVTLTLTDGDYLIQRLDCNGANRIVKLPPGADGNHPFLLINSTSSGAWTLTVQNNAGTVTYRVLNPGEYVYVVPDGNGAYLNTGLFRETDYKLAPTVAANNLTLTVTHADGTTPSATRPLWFKIADTWRAVTSALAVTVNAGVSTFNAGAVELATQEIDLFAYVGWRVSDTSVFLGFARLPNAHVDGDFSNTATNEKYIAASGAAPASTDAVTPIGRFAATNSGTAAFNWSVPTYTNTNLKHVSVYETRWLSWVPTRTGYSAVPTNITYQYRIIGDTLDFTGADGTAGTSNTTTHAFTLPFAAFTVTNQVHEVVCACDDNSAALTTPSYGSILTPNWSTVSIAKDFAAGAWTGSGTKRVRSTHGSYRIK